MRTEPIVRLATIDDAPAISALIRGLAAYFLADPQRPGDAAEFFDTITPAAVAERIASDRFRHHVAGWKDELAGVVVMREDRHLYHLFVAERFHRRGVGGLLWRTALDAALGAGRPERITVNASLHAVTLYAGFGFAPSAPARTEHGIAYQPMELRLTPLAPADA